MLLAQLGDLPLWLYLLILGWTFAIPACGLFWLGNALWRRRFDAWEFAVMGMFWVAWLSPFVMIAIL
jgi:hypothetical protein